MKSFTLVVLVLAAIALGVSGLDSSLEAAMQAESEALQEDYCVLRDIAIDLAEPQDLSRTNEICSDGVACYEAYKAVYRFERQRAAIVGDLFRHPPSTLSEFHDQLLAKHMEANSLATDVMKQIIEACRDTDFAEGNELALRLNKLLNDRMSVLRYRKQWKNSPEREEHVASLDPDRRDTWLPQSINGCPLSTPSDELVFVAMPKF